MRDAGQIRVVRSNRIEQLVDVLATSLREPPAGADPSQRPFAEEFVCIHSRGMESWLAAEISKRLGVCAQVTFPFPRSLLVQAFDALDATRQDPRVAAGSGTADVYEPPQLFWTLLKVLPPLLGEPAFKPLARYLDPDPSEASRQDKIFGAPATHRLVRRLAGLFDRYVTYRPETLAAWSAGEEDHWQAHLWRAVRVQLGACSFGDRAAQFQRDLSAGAQTPPGFPPRVFLFGISMLPPLYVSILASLATRVEVTLLQLSPSREYLGDLVTRREKIRALAAGRKDGLAPEDLEVALHLDEGHPILASLGRLGRDFQITLEEYADYAEDLVDHFVDPLTTPPSGPLSGRAAGEDDADAIPIASSALSALQSDLLHLAPGGAPGPSVRKRPLAPSDRSIEVHATHGAMRQVEVLRDRLLDALQQDPTLEPRDIVVMTPDIETYAPLFEAVFSRSDPTIPFRITDRSLRQESAVASATLATLELARHRATATRVFDLLTLPPVHQRFGISPDELDELADWVREAGIRWAIDEDDRVRHGQPAARENTWRFGLDRLLLGVAWSANDDLFHGVSPSGDVEGLLADLVGKFAEFTEVLFRALRELQAPRSMQRWHDAITRVVTTMLVGEGGAALERDRVLEQSRALAAAAAQAGYEDPVELDALIDLLQQGLTDLAAGAPFCSGGVTFCAMVPMRAVPFRVVCLVGMDDGSFPRRDLRLDFDLISARPRIGDRTRRDEDRYLILEALLSARDRLIITYSGANVQTNSELPPSVVVSELLDRLDEALSWEGGAARDRLVVRHPLAPFSPAYFVRDESSRLFSYAGEFVEGAKASLGISATRAPFLNAALPDPFRPGDVIELDDLIRFFENPAKGLLRQRLGLSFWEDDRSFEDREPIELDGLDRWRISDPIVRHALTDGGASRGLEYCRANGELPLGVPGMLDFESIRDEAAEFAGRAREILSPQTTSIDVDFPIGELRVRGRIEGVVEIDGRLRATHVRFSRRKAKHPLALWIRMLALAANGADLTDGRLLSRDSEGSITPPRDAPALFTDLVQRYRFGLTAPLLFQPEPSTAFAKARRGKDRSVEAALKAAHNQWKPDTSGYGKNEVDDPYVQRLYGDLDPTSPGFRWASPATPDGYDFASNAAAIAAPVLEHWRESTP